MGLWEYIKKSLNLGTDDMVMVHEVPMDSFRATDTTHTMRSGRYWPFKKAFMSADGRTMPGFACDPNMKIVNPYIYDAMMGDALRVLPMAAASTGPSHALSMAYLLAHFPERTIGAASGPYVTEPDEWKWGRVAITVAGGGTITDSQLVGAASGKKIQISIVGLNVVPVDAGGFVCGTLTIQDSDNVTLSGASVLHVGPYRRLDANSIIVPFTREWDVMRGPVAYSATNGLAIEVDGAAFVAGDVVEIIYAWREF